MYIVYVIGNSSEKMLFEEKNDAFEYALSVSKELEGTQVNVYKASLVATVAIPNEPVITKIRKQKIDVAKKTNKVSVASTAKKLNKLTRPPLNPILEKIAKDPEGVEEELSDIPLGARCALDNNIAVGRKKGPTGEYVYLCVDCMGAVSKNE